jgi:hypothetical protein
VKPSQKPAPPKEKKEVGDKADEESGEDKIQGVWSKKGIHARTGKQRWKCECGVVTTDRNKHVCVK